MRRWIPPLQRVYERSRRQRSRLLPAIGPTQDATRIAVHHSRQITPLASRLQVRHIAHPHLVRSGDFDLASLVLTANAGRQLLP